MEKRTINRILIANRGEIALRIIRTVRELGCEAIVVYEKPDRNACYLRFADRAIPIDNEPGGSYLNIEKMVKTAIETSADAIHPGYGFLAENADFASACEKAGIIFIGPPSSVIRNLGNKVLARHLAVEAGIPTIPGISTLSPGEDGVAEVLAFVEEHGYPVILKAVLGGGGRGMRKIGMDSDLEGQILRARAEAMSAFNSDAIYIEKFIESAKHVEVQILADSYGNIIHLGTRDCSIQRRHQKLIEVAPVDLTGDVIEAMHSAAIKISRASSYVNAGTVEFLVDVQTGRFWFMEINTRLQVEHSVTEMLTGVDIVRQQIEIAEGKVLGIRQEHVNLSGIAIEVRINAEDPKNNFMPEGGKMIEIFDPPRGSNIRVDGNIHLGYRIPTAYDSLLAKLIVRGYGWVETVQRLKKALIHFTVLWPKTTIPLYIAICNETDFMNRMFDTSYLENHPRLFEYPEQEYFVIDSFVYGNNAQLRRNQWTDRVCSGSS